MVTKKKRGKKVAIILKEVGEKEVHKISNQVAKLLGEFKKPYDKHFEKIENLDPNVRLLHAETIINSVIEDSKLPTRTIVGMLEGIKFGLLVNHATQTMQNIENIENEKKRSYVN